MYQFIAGVDEGVGVEWRIERAKTRQPWILRIYQSCLAGDDLFAAFTAETVNLSLPTFVHLSLFCSHLPKFLFVSYAASFFEK